MFIYVYYSWKPNDELLLFKICCKCRSYLQVCVYIIYITYIEMGSCYGN